MNLREVSSFLKFPIGILRRFKKKGLIHDPIRDEEISNLSFLMHVWRDKVLLRKALSHFSVKDRIKLAEQATLTKPERYALNRYLHSEEKRLFLKQVVSELKHYYKLPQGVALGVAKRMRARAYNMKWKKKKKENSDESPLP